MDRICNVCGKNIAWNEPATVTPGYNKWEGAGVTFIPPKLTCDDCLHKLKRDYLAPVRPRRQRARQRQPRLAASHRNYCRVKKQISRQPAAAKQAQEGGTDDGSSRV